MMEIEIQSVSSRHVLVSMASTSSTQLPTSFLASVQQISTPKLLHICINPSIILIILFQAVAHTGSPVYNIAWQGITNLTRNGPDKTVGATRTYLAPTSVGTLDFYRKGSFFHHPSSMPP